MKIATYLTRPWALSLPRGPTTCSVETPHGRTTLARQPDGTYVLSCGGKSWRGHNIPRMRTQAQMERLAVSSRALIAWADAQKPGWHQVSFDRNGHLAIDGETRQAPHAAWVEDLRRLARLHNAWRLCA